MKFVNFNGSPAGKNSATHVIDQAFLQGAQRAGAETETVFLIDKKIGYCKGCFACWFKTPGQCIMQDDMTELLEKYMTADVVCLGTPVFTWNMTAVLKNFLDRLVPLKSPLIVQNNDTFDLADTKPKEQKFVVISNCGFPGDKNFEIMKEVSAPCNPSLEIYRNCGKLLKSKDEAVKKIVDEYLAVVEQAGFEMAHSGEVTEKTKTDLQMPLMSVQDYVKYIGM
jgi:multimeric flavodoxin WrbA